LYDSYCQAALFAVPDAAKDKPQWLFCHPAGPNGRRNLTVRLSADEGRTWPNSLQLRAGDSQYSCLAQLPDGNIGCLYESWTDGNYRLYFTKFDVSRLNAK
jgi:sialidase-1